MVPHLGQKIKANQEYQKSPLLNKIIKWHQLRQKAKTTLQRTLYQLQSAKYMIFKASEIQIIKLSSNLTDTINKTVFMYHKAHSLTVIQGICAWKIKQMLKTCEQTYTITRTKEQWNVKGKARIQRETTGRDQNGEMQEHRTYRHEAIELGGLDHFPKPEGFLLDVTLATSARWSPWLRILHLPWLWRVRHCLPSSLSLSLPMWLCA